MCKLGPRGIDTMSKVLQLTKGRNPDLGCPLRHLVFFWTSRCPGGHWQKLPFIVLVTSSSSLWLPQTRTLEKTDRCGRKGENWNMALLQVSKSGGISTNPAYASWWGTLDDRWAANMAFILQNPRWLISNPQFVNSATGDPDLITLWSFFSSSPGTCYESTPAQASGSLSNLGPSKTMGGSLSMGSQDHTF